MRVSKLLGVLFFGLSLIQVSFASSETIEGRKGQFRLLSADINEEASYNIRTSIQYFKDGDLFNTGEDVEGLTAKIGAGYAIFPNLHLSAQGGFDISTVDVGATSQNYNLGKFSAAITGTYDLGKQFQLPANRFVMGASLWVDFSKVTRFFKGPNIIGTIIATGDWSEKEIPFRAHLNLGFQPGNGKRYFDDDQVDQFGNQINDFDRFGTRTINSYALKTGVGFEFPYADVIPSAEFLMDYVNGAGFSRTPKWVTVGLKGKPFPQKNIELFAAGDIGLSSYKETPGSEKPDAYAVPLWNVVLGFGMSQFGKRAGEVGVDAAQYNKTLGELRDRNEMIAALRKDLNYNTVTGRVIDARTNRPLSGVTVSFPEQGDLRSSETNEKGEFTRYFPHLAGARILFSKDGYEPSSKFYALKPGESVRAEIELREGSAVQTGKLVLNIANESGQAAASQVIIQNLRTNEQAQSQSDAGGRISLELAPGDYRIEIRSRGYKSLSDRIQIESGKAVLRSYTVTSDQ